MNPSFEQATGLGRELAMKGTAKEIVSGLEDAWVKRYGEIVRSGEAERFDNYSASMGRWFRVYAFPLGGDQFALLFSDITAEKAAEAEQDRLLQEIESERQRLEQVFAQSPVAIVVFRGRDFFVELANPPYRALIQGRELVGHRFRDVMPELGQDVWDAFNRVLDTGEPFFAKEWHIPYDSDRDGVNEDHWFNVAYNPIREPNGTVSGMIAVLTEVTAQVLFRQELELVNRDLEEFAYVSSHDLQEPLRMVNAYTQLLLRRCMAEDEKARTYSEYIRQGVSRMEALLRDLLSYSRAVHNDNSIFGAADLTEALSRTLEMLKTHIEEAKATVVCDPLPVVRGDAAQLVHVFQNVISNALKFRSPDAAPSIHISVEQDGERWTISVSDNGIGFDQKYAERIFGLFKRLHKDEYPGNGLGLAICHRIVERHGGRIWARSKPGIGSTFSFSLPSAQVQ
jgi:PAS domain S-box-containing protein